MDGLRLLVIDDEPAVTVVITHAARQWGVEVTAARTIAEARLALDTEAAFDVLLIDVALPDGSGLDLLAELRQDPQNRDCPAIVLTGAGDEQLLADARNLGAEVVTKPFSPSKLRDLIFEVCGREGTSP